MHIPGADWRPMPTDDAMDAFDIDGADIELVLADSPFPDALVHRGDLTVDGPLAISGDAIRLHVIAGDLTVKGALCFRSAAASTALVVTGSIIAHALGCLGDALLVVCGAVDVDALLLTSLTDAGGFVVKGAVSAGAWIEAGDRGNIEYAEEPAAHLFTNNGAVADPYGNAHYFGLNADVASAQESVLPEFVTGGHLDTDRICAAMLSGAPILR